MRKHSKEHPLVNMYGAPPMGALSREYGSNKMCLSVFVARFMFWNSLPPSVAHVAVLFEYIPRPVPFTVKEQHCPSLIPRPERGRRKGPGFHYCLRMCLTAVEFQWHPRCSIVHS